MLHVIFKSHKVEGGKGGGGGGESERERLLLPWGRDRAFIGVGDHDGGGREGGERG